MQRRSLINTGAICVTILAAAAIIGRAGPPDPPPGPVTPTNKTLDEVEPRTPVQSLPVDAVGRHIISEPGSYYLTGNLAGAPFDGGIRINASNVTLDLNGFAMLGTDAGTAIFSAADDVTVRNGTITGWTLGVAFEGERCRIDNLIIVGSSIDGIEFVGGQGRITDCTIEGSGMEGIHLGVNAHNTTIVGCKLRNNTRRQILVQADGNMIEGCALLGEAGVTEPALDLQGDANIVRASTVTIGEPDGCAVDISGDGNRLDGNTVRVLSSATGAEGIVVTGDLNEANAGSVQVEAASAIGIRFDTGFNIIAILIGLLESADGSTGVLMEAGGLAQGITIDAIAPNSRGVLVQGGATNVGARIMRSQIRATGAGSQAIRSDATASIIQMNGIVMGPGAGHAINLLGSAGGHSISQNEITLAGTGQVGVSINGAADRVVENSILVLGDNSTGISQASGTTGLISRNVVRLGAATGATGILVPDFVGDLVTKNLVLGAGTRFDVGEGNASAQIIVNPGNGFIEQDNLNYEVGP